MKIYLKCILGRICIFLLVKNYLFEDNFPFWEFHLGNRLQVIGKKTLDDFKRKHALARETLNAWTAEAEEETWTCSQDIKNRYSAASFLDGNKIIFNINGNHYRLVVQVDYLRRIVLVLWVGTHAEYTKKKF